MSVKVGSVGAVCYDGISVKLLMMLKLTCSASQAGAQYEKAGFESSPPQKK